jgi:hypothetical protein
MLKPKIIIRVSGMILLAVAVSLAVVALIYAVQHPNLVAVLGTIGWNGNVNY